MHGALDFIDTHIALTLVPQKAEGSCSVIPPFTLSSAPSTAS